MTLHGVRHQRTARMTSGPLNSHAQDKCTLQRHAHWFPRLRPGETPHFSTFNDNDFAEAASDAQLNDDRLSTVACRYWILKLQARLISGDHELPLPQVKGERVALEFG